MDTGVLPENVSDDKPRTTAEILEQEKPGDNPVSEEETDTPETGRSAEEKINELS